LLKIFAKILCDLYLSLCALLIKISTNANLVLMLLEKLPEVRGLPINDKWQLLNELWADLAHELKNAEPQSEIVTLLRDRFKVYLQDPSQGSSIDAAFLRLQERKSKWS
jgi:hypothetical protein